ncbi:tetratricopeptide repeat protein [Croceiramulus getboli]|nr:tetratricopeptide repeat protein [Flavobacteriaceae bacterium YJPT1-3]
MKKSSFTEAYFYSGLNYTKTHNEDIALEYFEKALELYENGFKVRNPYNEVVLELYHSCVIREILQIKQGS